MLSYKLFSDARAILASPLPLRAPERVAFFFDGDCAGCTLIIENSVGDKLYRRLSDGRASVPASFLVGRVRVTLASLDDSANVRWRCDGFVAEKCGSAIWLLPELIDVRRELLSLRSELEVLKKSAAALEACLAGYDVL